ncbi:DUF4157 domain-containing protein [Leptolyngbya sp. FACHB-321]|nr:DUF4157 domain-containing protein [Leptolyngbya sp. FACHB-321]
MKLQEQADWASLSVENSAPHESRFQANLATVPVQCKAGTAQTITEKETKRPNQVGLPDTLKAGLEQLSGLDMSDVQIHYNSSKPAQLQALAYTQGTEIHVAPGQEKHLPHEGWHVVQQKQGRAQATMQLPGNVSINDDQGLEREADIMGAKALQPLRVSTTSHPTQLSSQKPIQKKSRIDLTKVALDERTREEIKQKIETLKANKRQAKKDKTSAWATSSGEDISRDKTYNDEIAKIREEFEKSIKALAKDTGLAETVLISGDKYYGDEVEEDAGNGKKLKFHRRDDTGKEYVKDSRGTFVPRYIRRELNHKDDLTSGITTQGINNYDALWGKKSTWGPGRNGSLTWEDREFLQQSIGGGGNQFALSHTSTKRPILSNAHESFGAKSPQKYTDGKVKTGSSGSVMYYPHSGAIMTDLAKMGDTKFAAQWEIDKVTGHKVPLPEGKHSTLDWYGFNSGGSYVKGAGKARDEVVRMSGYRNMEVVAEGVPKQAIIQPETWKNIDEGPKKNYQGGESKRGQEMVKFREQKQKESLEKIKQAREKEVKPLPTVQNNRTQELLGEDYEVYKKLPPQGAVGRWTGVGTSQKKRIIDKLKALEIEG